MQRERKQDWQGEKLVCYNTVTGPQLTPQGPLQSHPTYLAEAGFYGPALTDHWV